MDNLTPIYQAPRLPKRPQLSAPVTNQQQASKKGRGRDKYPRLTRVVGEAAPLRNRALPERDIAILEAVQSYRVLSSEQIQSLLFAGIGPDQPRARLRKLFHSGYLFRGEMPLQKLSEGRKPFLYFLDTKGAALLAQKWQLPVKAVEWSKKDRELNVYTYKHLLLTNDIHIALTRSAQAHGLAIPIWKNDKTLKREHHTDPILIPTPDGTRKRTWVEPDGYVCLAGETPAGMMKRHLYIELDRGTESGTSQSMQKRSWTTKILAYLSYYRAGKFHQRYHAKGMTVLTVTTGKEGRLSTLKQATEAAGGKTRFMFTTLERLSSADILTDQIWSVATSDERRSILQPTP
jgi:hypothetical protein